MKRANTRYDTNRFPFSPYWLVEIQWDNERCGNGAHPLKPGFYAAYDPSEQMCWCLRHAHNHLRRLAGLPHFEEDDEGRPKRPRLRRRRPKTPTWTPTPQEPF